MKSIGKIGLGIVPEGFGNICLEWLDNNAEIH